MVLLVGDLKNYSEKKILNRYCIQNTSKIKEVLKYAITYSSHTVHLINI